MGLNPQAKLLWEQIRNPNCTECPLHQEAQTVCLIGDGPVPAKIMIVGEAPGFREDEVSRPFSGKSGRLLDEVLEKNRLRRDQAFITNVNKCRPPDNRTPNKTEQKACRHYLDDEVEAVKPEFILLLGNSALSLIKKSGIMKHRGEWHDYGDAKVLATVHPAAVLRNPRYGRVFETDVATFSRMVRGERGTISTRTFLVRDRRALSALCEAILRSDACAYDFETNGFDDQAEDAAIACLSVSPKPGYSFVVPIHHPESPWKNPDRVLSIVGNALAYSKAKLIAHNAKFDDKWFRTWGVEINATFDTMLAAHILDENRMKSLKVLAPMILGVDPWADVDLSNGGAMLAPLKKLARYNGKDTDYTLRLYHVFRDELREEVNRRTLRLFTTIMMPASQALTDIEQVGLWLDQERLAERRILVQKNMERVRRKLNKIAGYEANWNSPKQISEILFGKLGLPIINLTKTGAASTGESVLLQLAAEGHEVANLILEWRKWAKYESTYLGNWSALQHNGRIRANYKIAGTVTGRLSSGKEEGSKDRGLNAQQIPRDPFIRGVIGAPPGWKFVEADFSQIELRIVAHYSQDPTMLRIFQTDGDIHLATAQKITQKPPDRIEKEERKKAKGVNFGFVFGMGSNKFVDYARDSYGVYVSDAEARLFRERFFDQFSRLPGWHDRQRRLARQYRRVQSAIGRVRHLPDIDSEDKEVRAESERQAINSPVQSLASDMMLLALIILHAKMDPSEARIVGTVHDSILFEVREDVVDRWAKEIKYTMEHLPLKKKFGVELSVPIKADVTVGTHWGEGEEI